MKSIDFSSAAAATCNSNNILDNLPGTSHTINNHNEIIGLHSLRNNLQDIFQLPEEIQEGLPSSLHTINNHNEIIGLHSLQGQLHDTFELQQQSSHPSKDLKASSHTLHNHKEIFGLHALQGKLHDIYEIQTAANNNIMNTKDAKRILDELNVDDSIIRTKSVVDYCDNPAQMEVLRHHYANEFGSSSSSSSGRNDDVEIRNVQETEVVKDYVDDSIIHKVVDDQPSTYRGRDGAVQSWHDLTSYLGKRGGITNNNSNTPTCNFDLTHVSVCRNHAQVNWKVECNDNNKDKSKIMTLLGTDSFTFDDTNHIKMQTTVALSEKQSKN